MTNDVHSELEMKNAFGWPMKTRRPQFKSVAGSLLEFSNTIEQLFSSYLAIV
jgi:hypothetical protein